MSWRILGEDDAGDETHYGGADMAKISDFLAEANLDIIDFASNIFFRDRRLRLKNEQNSRTITIRTNAITADTELTIPPPAGNEVVDTMLTSLSSTRVYNKTINAWENTMGGAAALPSVKQQGWFLGGGPYGAWSGLLDDSIHEPSLPTRGIDITYGPYHRYNSTTTQDTLTGLRPSYRALRKEWQLYYRCKTRVPTLANTRQYVGFSYEMVVPSSDKPIDDNDSGFLIGWRSDDTHIHVFTNAGTPQSPTTASVTNTGISRSTAPRQYEILFTSPTNCRVRILDGNGTAVLYTENFNTNLPEDIMAPVTFAQNTTTTAIDYDIFFVEVEQTIAS